MVEVNLSAVTVISSSPVSVAAAEVVVAVVAAVADAGVVQHATNSRAPHRMAFPTGGRLARSKAQGWAIEQADPDTDRRLIDPIIFAPLQFVISSPVAKNVPPGNSSQYILYCLRTRAIASRCSYTTTARRRRTWPGCTISRHQSAPPHQYGASRHGR